jgi:hypothetical protein
MNETNTGGPAFPTATLAQKTEGGMTLRDYFAAKALRTFSDDTDELMMENAIKAYKQADAMLKAREA